MKQNIFNYCVSKGSDKTWVENEPERISYESQHVDPSQKEEKTQVVFITLTTLFVVIVICCIIEVYRTNRAHRKRIERETDESIIWSKEQATKLFESPNAKAFNYKPVSIMALNRIFLLKLRETVLYFIHHDCNILYFYTRLNRLHLFSTVLLYNPFFIYIFVDFANS